MRIVVPGSEVPHLWANQSQPEARNQTNSIYFRDNTIYSYGGHFPMARHVDGIVLFTIHPYSVTTSGHLSWTAYACNHLKVFNVSNVLADCKAEHKRNFEDYRERYIADLVLAGRARKYGQMHLNSAENIRNEANEYSRFFKIRMQIKPADIKQVAKRAKKQRKAELLATKKRAAERHAALIEQVIKWRAGEAHSLPWSYSQTILRLSDGGDTVQTSHGARFPASHARRALPIVRRCVKQGKAWTTNGHAIHLGNHQINKIHANGDIQAGCHFVKYAEIQRLDALLSES